MNYDDMNFEQKFNYLVTAYPHARGEWLKDRLYNSLVVVDGVAPLPAALPSEYEIWGYWILDSPRLSDMMESEPLKYSKIHLIKEVRSLTQMGLKESKDAVEFAVILKREGILSQTQAEQLNKDVEDVITSLTGGTDE